MGCDLHSRSRPRQLDATASFNGVPVAGTFTYSPTSGTTLSAGAQTLSTAVTTAKPVVYTFSGQAISQSAAIALANGNSGITACGGSPPTFTKTANIDQITLSQNSTFVTCVILVGQSGSFTGNGIVLTGGANFATVQGNNISGEAAQAIKVGSNSAQIEYNTVSQSAAATAISGCGTISFNNVTVNAGDGIDLTGNQCNAVAARSREADRRCGQLGPKQSDESLVDKRSRNRDLPRPEQERPALGYLNRMDRDRRRCGCVSGREGRNADVARRAWHLARAPVAGHAPRA